MATRQNNVYNKNIVVPSTPKATTETNKIETNTTKPMENNNKSKGIQLADSDSKGLGLDCDVDGLKTTQKQVTITKTLNRTKIPTVMDTISNRSPIAIIDITQSDHELEPTKPDAIIEDKAPQNTKPSSLDGDEKSNLNTPDNENNIPEISPSLRSTPNTIDDASPNISDVSTVPIEVVKDENDDEALPEFDDDDPILLLNFPDDVVTYGTKIEIGKLPKYIKPGYRFQLFISEINNPYRFWFQLNEDIHELDSLMNGMR